MTNMFDIYEDVLSGKRQKFTQGTWELHNGGLENFKRCLRYLVLEKLKLNRKQFTEEVSFQFLKKWRLASPAQTLYKCHTLNIVNDIFPEWNIKGWELRAVPPFFWNGKTIKESVRHFILEDLKWDREDLVSKFNSGMIKSTRCGEAMVRFREQELYNEVGRSRSGSYALLLYCFPEYNLKIWEFDGVMETWEEQDIRDALNWLFREKLKWDDNEIKLKISKKVFMENGFGSFFHTFFRCSSYRVMTFLFPNGDWEYLKKNKDKNFKNKPDYSFVIYKR